MLARSVVLRLDGRKGEMRWENGHRRWKGRRGCGSPYKAKYSIAADAAFLLATLHSLRGLQIPQPAIT
jgi:hypothetical protein